MLNVLMLLLSALTGLFCSKGRLEAEILVLRQQINVLLRKSPKRSVLSNLDRLVFVGLYRLAPGIVNALAIVRPETVIRWHRAGFRSFWRWKSRRRGGRPRVPLEIRRLIGNMSLGNPLWGAPPHPWRTAQARHRCRPDERCKVYGAGEARALAGLEDLSVQSRRRHRLGGPVRRADSFLSATLRFSGFAAPSTSNHVAGGDGKPDS